MKPLDAALSAFYPAIVVMGLLIWARFLPLLKTVSTNTRPLVCSMLVIVSAVMLEQVVYGYGRVTGNYTYIIQHAWLVAAGKILYCAGFAYMLYAFWLLSVVRPRVWVSLSFAFALWAMLFGALLV